MASASTRFEVYRSAWESAMAKAGVRAAFPAEPIPLTRLSAEGRHDFSATFTSEEVTALVNLYRFQTAITSRGDLVRARIAFRGAERVRLVVTARYNGSQYNAEMTARARFEGGRIRVEGVPELGVEGLPIPGSYRDQIVSGIVAYLNDYLAAAPGLTVCAAEVTAEGLRVSGEAPDVISAPDS